MRRITILLAATLVGGGLALFVGVPNASAQCPLNDGTIPGSSASVITIGPDDGAAFQTYFIDDRDFLDLNDNGDAGGLWLYAENNNTQGLTRGGDHVVFSVANPPVPFIPPIVVLPPDPNRPVFPNGITLFPNGIGGGTLSELVGEHDDCQQSGGLGQPATSDAILF